MAKGKAYGIFNVDASADTLENNLPIFRKDANTPSDLELSLSEGKDGIPGLDTVAKDNNARYVLEATYNDHSDLEAADELAVILNLMYSSNLGDTFEGMILYKDDTGEYTQR